MSLDVEHVRACFPALSDGVAYFDGPGGSQVPGVVGEAVAQTLCVGISNRGDVTQAERRADDVVVGARAAISDLVGCRPGEVVFARSMTQATYDLSRALAKQWGPDDEVVVTRIDHDANIRPWVAAAEGAGATVRWAGFDRDTAELSVDDVREQLSPRTRLLAVTGASNLLGTRPDVPAIVDAAREVGAQVFVDGVHLTPHAAIDFDELGADYFACSPYKFFGPHLGVLVGRANQLERVRPDKLLPSSDEVPERFELGTLPYEMLAGVTATVDFIADLASTAADRRTRVLESMQSVEEHEEPLFARLLDGLARSGKVTVHGSAKRRTPTALFSVAGHPGQQVYEHLATRGVNAPASSFYAIEASRWIGLGDDGAVRAGLAPYTNEDDVDRLLAGVDELAR